MVTKGWQNQETILPIYALFCGNVNKTLHSTFSNDACNLFRENRTRFDQPVHVLFTCKLQMACMALSRSKLQRNLNNFSNPLYFEPPVNSNQKSFPFPQSKTVILHPISRTALFQISFCLSWRMDISGFHFRC